MSAILMTVERVATRASTSEALLTLSVPLEHAALISAFLSKIGDQVGVAFADADGSPLVSEEQKRASGWAKLAPLTQSAIKLCTEPLFQRFVAENIDNHAGFKSATEAECATYIKDRCGVASRRDLERVDGAREKFGAMMSDYREWQRAL